MTLEAMGYHADGPPFATLRPDRSVLPMIAPDGTRVVVKSFRSGRGQTVFANMRALWRSSFGQARRPPGMARPFDYIAALDAVVMERLEGWPLLELGAAGEELLRESIALIAALHSSQVAEVRQRDAQRVARSVARKLTRIAELSPENTALLRRIAGAIETRLPADGELVPTHGDFSPRNVLFDGQRARLIDWDRLRLADPARDLAYFAARNWSLARRRGEAGDWEILSRICALYESMRPGRIRHPNLAFHLAAALIRGTLTMLELTPTKRHLAPIFLAEALVHLR